MDMPGLSLFQGGESLKINSSLQRIEEEEALEDQKRRNEELQNQLQNAFDDLIDDEDETVDTSVNFQSHLSSDSYMNLPGQHNFNAKTNKKVNEFGQGDRQPSQPPPDYYNHQQQTEVSKLRNLLESKSLDYDKLNLRYNEEKDKLESQCNELRKRLTLSEAEKERTNMSRQQTHELLVESKTKASDLEDKISKLKSKIKAVENTNTELVTELEHTKTMLSDAQHKFHLVERNIGLNADKHTDALLKQANDRHNGQMEIMQQQVNNIQSKLEDREMELKTLDARYKELQRSREQLLCDKSETINQLAKNLEDSQRQCQQLISRPDLTQENIRLERLLAARERQTDDMQKTINSLSQKLEATSVELQLMDSVLCDGTDSSDAYRMLSPKIGNLPASTPFATTDERLGRLKNELLRCMSSQKQKRDEIKLLEEKLMKKNDEINDMKNNENDTLLKMNKYKDESNVLLCKLNAMENELRKIHAGSGSMRNVEKSIKDENEQKIRKLEEKCIELEEQLEEVTVNYTNVKKDYEVLVTEKRTLVEENRKMSLDVEKNKFLLNEARTECEHVKTNYIELSNIRDNLSRELSECRGLECNKELYVQKERVSSLENALEIAEMKCNEMRKLSDANNKEHKQLINDLHEKYEKEISDLNREFKVKRSPCRKCIDLTTQLTQYDISNLELRNENKHLENTVTEKSNEIDNMVKKMIDLEKKLDLKEERDNLIIQLKEKALEFESFMQKQSSNIDKNNNNNNNNMNMVSKAQQTIFIEYKDQSCATSPKASATSCNGNCSTDAEKRIREDVTKSFAVQVKNLEENYKLQIEKYQNMIKTLKTDSVENEEKLIAQTTDINLLKQVILVEREKIKEIIESLENQVKLLTGTNNDLTSELDLSKKRLKRLNDEMVEKTEQITNERGSMNLLITQYNNEKKRLINEINLLQANNVNEYKEKYLQLKEKYESAKRTVQNYKQYSEDKEKHMVNEAKRMFDEYRSKLEKIEKKFQHKIESVEDEYKKKINIMEKEYRKN